MSVRTVRTPAGGAGLGLRLVLLSGFIALIWLVELTDLVVFHGALDRAGIRPRTESGLWGIAYAPFLHAGLAHLIANTVPLLVLGWLVLVRGLRDWLWVTVVVVLAGGLGVWLFGRPGTVHIGASGLIFGYLGYLLLRGFWERSLMAVAIAVLAGVLYGGALWGVLPGQRGVSWEGHLFGFAGGAAAAGVHRRREAAAADGLTAAARSRPAALR
ncbi:MAG TPA: rhomboid family intramembrane serine protease [Chloroflexota bacterium]|nr:rhomboid family intramembrane serine protease [Chloroflexota bacterium]